MKRIITSGIAALAAVLFIAGCENDPSSSPEAPNIRPMAAGGADAHPAIAFRTTVTSKGKNYRAIAVIDSDGTDQAAIYTLSGTTDANDIFPGPSWSPNGGTLAFYIYGSAVSDGIILRDVSVSRGKAVGSNTRTLYTPDTGYVRSLAWCSNSGTAKIAFSTLAGGYSSRLFVIPPSGGTPTLLYAATPGDLRFYDWITWSPDDSKIAFVDRRHSTGEDTIRVISASTGSLLEVIPLGATNWTQIEWSRSGVNTLAMTVDYGTGAKLYYVTPTTGSTPTTNNVSGKYPTWSPNNSSVVTVLPGTSSSLLQKTITGTTTTTTIATGIIGVAKWKR